MKNAALYGMKILFISLILFTSITASGDEPCTKEKAVYLAKEQFEIKYTDYKNYEPYVAESHDDKWVIYGTLPKLTLGGTPQANIEKYTCKIVDVYTTRRNT